MSSTSPGRAPTSDLIDHEAIHHQCSQVVHEFIEMINWTWFNRLTHRPTSPSDTRQYNTSHRFWTEHIASNYSYSGLHGDFGDVAVDLAAQLGMFGDFWKVFPTFRLEPLGMWTEISPLDAKGEGVVRSVLNYCQVNCPEGVVKKSAAESRWMRVPPEEEEDEGVEGIGRLCIWECRTVAGGG